ncbi:MAG: FAD-dependent protein [Christensenellaceae bacterium]
MIRLWRAWNFSGGWSRRPFGRSGGLYAAPVQLVGTFEKKESGGAGSVLPSYAAGASFAELDAVWPAPLTSALRAAIVDMARRLQGFAWPDAVLTAVESRTSSPLRIERETDMQSPSAKGLYPCGEGAGYAGGITSSAADGLRVAEAVFSKFCV